MQGKRGGRRVEGGGGGSKVKEKKKNSRKLGNGVVGRPSFCNRDKHNPVMTDNTSPRGRKCPVEGAEVRERRV